MTDPDPLGENMGSVAERLGALKARCRGKLAEQGFTEACIRLEPYLHLRYEGTDAALMTLPRPPGPSSDPKVPMPAGLR